MSMKIRCIDFLTYLLSKSHKTAGLEVGPIDRWMGRSRAVEIGVHIALWCNGSTSDFESERVGPNPAEAASGVPLHRLQPLFTMANPGLNQCETLESGA